MYFPRQDEAVEWYVVLPEVWKTGILPACIVLLYFVFCYGSE